ncbi:MAG: APC family permease [Eubacteriales bacterium]
MEDNRLHGEYDRYLTPLDVWAIAFGCTIGWGAFMMPGSTFLPVAGPLGTAIAMAISVAIMLVIGANFFFLMRNRPGTGGVYAYTKAAFGREHAFLCAWFLSLSYLTVLFMNATSLFLVIRMVFGRRLQYGYYYYNIAGNHIFMGEVGASIVALASVGLLFINAKPLLQKLQTILAIILLGCVVFIAAMCLPHLSPDTLRGAFGIRGGSPAFGIFSIVMLAPWAFVGFEVISLETAHFDFRIHRSRWIIIASIVLSGIVYIVLTLIGVSSVPDGYSSWQTYIADLGQLDGVSAVPTFNAANSIMGTAGLLVMAIAALAAILTGMIAAYRATTRVLSTMAEDRILSERFSKTTYSILFIMVVSILISIFGRNALQCFMELTSLGAVIAFAYTSAAAWKIARTQGNRTFAVLGALGTVISVGFLLVQLIPGLTALETMGTDAFLLLTLWCLLGFMFYLRTVSRSSAAAYMGSPTAGVWLFALLLYSALLWLGKRLMAADSLQAVHDTLRLEGPLMLAVVFIALIVSMSLQRTVRKKHDAMAAKHDEATTTPNSDDHA